MIKILCINFRIDYYLFHKPVSVLFRWYARCHRVSVEAKMRFHIWLFYFVWCRQMQHNMMTFGRSKHMTQQKEHRMSSLQILSMILLWVKTCDAIQCCDQQIEVAPKRWQNDEWMPWNIERIRQFKCNCIIILHIGRVTKIVLREINDRFRQIPRSQMSFKFWD